MSLEDSVDEKRIFCCLGGSLEKIETNECVDSVFGWWIKYDFWVENSNREHEMQIQIHTHRLSLHSAVCFPTRVDIIISVQFISHGPLNRSKNEKRQTFLSRHSSADDDKQKNVRFIDRGGFHWHRFICGDISLIYLSSLAHFSYRTMHTMSSLFLLFFCCCFVFSVCAYRRMWNIRRIKLIYGCHSGRSVQTSFIKFDTPTNKKCSFFLVNVNDDVLDLGHRCVRIFGTRRTHNRFLLFIHQIFTMFQFVSRLIMCIICLGERYTHRVTSHNKF